MILEYCKKCGAGVYRKYCPECGEPVTIENEKYPDIYSENNTMPSEYPYEKNQSKSTYLQKNYKSDENKILFRTFLAVFVIIIILVGGFLLFINSSDNNDQNDDDNYSDYHFDDSCIAITIENLYYGTETFEVYLDGVGKFQCTIDSGYMMTIDDKLPSPQEKMYLVEVYGIYFGGHKSKSTVNGGHVWMTFQ